MEDIEDIGRQIKCTDSQKSVATSNAYSQDFTDSSSDKNQSSGKETYVIDIMDNDNENVYPLHSDQSILNIKNNNHVQSERRKIKKYRKSHHESVLAEDTYTQTSKTIFELRNEVSIQNTAELQHFETQTSFVTITGIKSDIAIESDREVRNQDVCQTDETKLKTLYSNAFDDSSSILKESEIDCESSGNDGCDHEENFIPLKRYESKDASSDYYYNDTVDESTDDESWNINSDIEEDSLMQNEKDRIQLDYSSDIESDTLESVENDVLGLYQTLENVPKARNITFPDSALCDISVLTTVTEETNFNSSILDTHQVCTGSNNINAFKDPHRAAQSKLRIQSLFNSDTNENDTNKILKLPSIYTNSSRPKSPMVKPRFSVNQKLPNQHEASPNTMIRHGYKNPASGECSDVYYIKQDADNNAIQVELPPIQYSMFSYQYHVLERLFSKNQHDNKDQETRHETINIRDKIQDLKVNHRNTIKSEVKKRNNSPSQCLVKEPKACEIPEKGCDNLCTDIMRRLQSNTWQEVAETLLYLPKSLESFWSIMSEMRIADLLRQIVNLVESPRTQVAQAACEAAAHLLKHTNFTKKPDFYEAVGVLLAKTNSYNRAVRRAANLSLDELVSGLHYTHCIAAICVGGVEHKSPLVRCASSRLLIVCCALAEGGRRLLRCRPPSAATARRHVLRAMALLLHDKNLETRKYAERLYAILRPLPNFEEYFLSDVDVGMATEHMKKYDHIILNSTNTR